MKLGPDVTLSDGRYRLERRLGAGGMASVWLARDERLGRQVAVKVVADTLADDEHWLERFKREARAAAALSHPTIVRVFDYGVESGRPYLVMEHIPGVDLAARLADRDAAPPDPAALARELLDALTHVHEAGILHRDIKPANILLDAQGNAHLTDFGIAQPEDATSLTQTGMVIGTLRYLAPEVADGGPATVLSDLYSAGVVVREIAGDAAPPELAALIGALTATDPDQRPGSASAARALLEGATAPTRVMGTDATDRPAAAASAARAWLRGRGIPPGLAVGGTLALLAVLLVVALSSGGDPSSRDSASGRSGPAPAQPGAALERQLRALDRVIDDAAQQ